jgi:predicted MPP superfamily phosphohydrolase
MVQHFFGAGHPELFRVLTQLGTTWGVVLAVGLALWLWGRRDAYPLVGIVLLEAIISFGLNQVVDVPRPAASEVIKYEHVQVGSFPSGHTFLATVLWGLLWARRRVPGWLFALAVLAVGVARLYLGVHYLVDVLAGALLGLLLVWAYRPLWRWAEPRLARWPAGAWVAVSLLAVVGVGATYALGYYGDNPFKWHAGGLVLAGAPALLLEWRWVRHAPAGDDAGTRALKVALALLVLVPLAWMDRAAGESPYALGAALIALGALCAWLLAPAWFVRLDLARERMPERRSRAWHATKTIVLTILGVLVALVVYGTAVEPRLYLDVEEHTVELPGLPAQWEGREIAALGDFQVGMWWHNTGMMRRMVARVVEERPSAVLLLGDFVYRVGEDHARELETVRGILAPLAASGIPTFAVLGNHDWGLQVDSAEADREAGRAVREMLEELDVRVLHNEAAALAREGAAEPLYIVGIGSHYLGADRPDDALSAVPASAARVVFMHHPDSYEMIPAGVAPLAVAGHTHGGQLALPFTPQWSWMAFTKEDEVHADGWVEEGYGAPGNRLYVNRGVGFSVVPIRIGAAPELTVFTLTSALDP